MEGIVKLQIKATLLTDMLGTQPNNTQLFEDYIKSKAPESIQDDEALNIDPEEVIEKGTTVYRRSKSGQLCLCDYQIKGFIKTSGDTIRQRLNEKKSKGSDNKIPKSGWESWKSKVDTNVHVFPRLIELGKTRPDDILSRPLRAKTMQGERVSLARSEVIAADTVFYFEIVILGLIKKEQIIHCLNEGKYYGLGQWRNAGYGRFMYEIVSIEEGQSK